MLWKEKGKPFVSISPFTCSRNYKKHLQQLETIKRKKNPLPLERISMLDNMKLVRANNLKFLRSGIYLIALKLLTGS